MTPFLDLFSGIGTAAFAFEPSGWRCIAQAEIDRFATSPLTDWEAKV